MLGCGLLLVANLLLGLVVWRLDLRTQALIGAVGGQLPANPDLPPLSNPVAFGDAGDGGYTPSIAPDLTAAGAVRAEFSFRVTTKQPGATYSLRHRVGDAEWRETPADEVGPLQYQALVELATEPGASLSYQAISRLDGEVVTASEVHQSPSILWWATQTLSMNAMNCGRVSRI